MSRISSEQPPTDDPALAEWLTRLVTQANTALDSVEDMEPIGQLPERVFNGMRRYFNAPIDPDITKAGAWIYEENLWQPYTEDGSLVNLIEVSGIAVIAAAELFSNKINIILVGAAGSQISLPIPDATKLVWVQQNFGGGGTFDVITP